MLKTQLQEKHTRADFFIHETKPENKYAPLMDALRNGEIKGRVIQQLAGNSMQASSIGACQIFVLAFTERVEETSDEWSALVYARRKIFFGAFAVIARLATSHELQL